MLWNSGLCKKSNVFNNEIKVELDNNFKRNDDDTYNLSINYIGDKSKLDRLKKGLKDIKYNDFRFYIFGTQKLPQINGYENFEIDFKNKYLNEKQKEAIKKALLSEKMFMIQGPPGTGKTSVISEIAYQETIKGKKVLISSESNDAIENALERLDEDIFYPILYQSVNREKKNNSTNLPTENKVGAYYKKRILKNLNVVLNKNLLLIKNNILYTSEKQKLEENYDLELQKGERTKNTIKYMFNQDLKQLNKKFNSIEFDKDITIFNDIQKEFFEELSENEKCEDELKDFYLEKINIFGATLNQIGKVSKKTQSEIFDVVIIDEVSKATPIELNLAILQAKKIILVGDQKQLPPMLDRDIELEEFADKIFKNSKDKTKQEIRQELHNHKTVFEKLIDNNSHAYTQLTTQYRMHENIQNAINQFYNENLKCGLDNETRKNEHQLFDGHNLVWIDTSISIEERHNPSFSNENEVKKTKLILEILEQEYEDIDFKQTIGVISFYGKQVDKLSNIKNNFKNIEVDFGTVDTFQGQERDFIIVSMVRSNKNSNIGFARSLNRINVAFSRAKQLLIVLGSYKTFTNIQKKDDKDIIKAKKIYSNIYDISKKGIL